MKEHERLNASTQHRQADRHFGERLAPLMAEHLPATFNLLVEGLTLSNGYGLVRVRTRAGDHWVVVRSNFDQGSLADVE